MILAFWRRKKLPSLNDPLICFLECPPGLSPVRLGLLLLYAFVYSTQALPVTYSGIAFVLLQMNSTFFYVSQTFSARLCNIHHCLCGLCTGFKEPVGYSGFIDHTDEQRGFGEPLCDLTL